MLIFCRGGRAVLFLVLSLPYFPAAALYGEARAIGVGRNFVARHHIQAPWRWHCVVGGAHLGKNVIHALGRLKYNDNVFHSRKSMRLAPPRTCSVERGVGGCSDRVCRLMGIRARLVTAEHAHKCHHKQATIVCETPFVKTCGILD